VDAAIDAMQSFMMDTLRPIRIRWQIITHENVPEFPLAGYGRYLEWHRAMQREWLPRHFTQGLWHVMIGFDRMTLIWLIPISVAR